MFPPIKSRFIVYILLANVFMFLFRAAAPGFTFRYLAITPALVFMQPWTLLTNMFIHADVTHIFFNMLGLFFFGPRLEERLGGRHVLSLYFVSGINLNDLNIS